MGVGAERRPLQAERRRWSRDRVAVTVLGRRNNFYKSLEKKVSGFLINQYHWSTVGRTIRKGL